MVIRRICALVLVSGLMASAVADAQGFWERIGFKKPTELSEEVVRDGLREALTVGIDRTVKLVGKNDGYFKSKDLKIPMPKALRRIERPLRAAGYGAQVDEYILSMNRAAEAAAPLAKEIFVDVISEMTVKDAKSILKGRDTAATEYLDKHTRERLAELFKPHIRKTMNQYGVTKKYQAIISKYSSLPFAKKYLDGNVETYTTDKALDGLFLVLGREEKKIRTKPVARSTDLLKKVFGR